MVPADEETRMDRREGKRAGDREAVTPSDASVRRPDGAGGGQPAEDRAMKETSRLFGKELMTRLGVKGRMLRIAPTEEIWLGSKSFNQDFNYVMEDGSWVHLEFESDQITVKDLRRFRAYEAVTSYHHRVEVVSYVLCSSRVKILKDKLENGPNVYRIQTIRIKDREAIGMTVLGQMLVQKGRAEGKAEDILDLLSEIGGVPAELAARIKCEQDDGTLRRWLRSAAKADSVEQFEQMM